MQTYNNNPEQNNNNETAVSKIEPKFNKKGLIMWMIITIVTILIIVGLSYFFINSKQPKTETIQKNIISPTPQTVQQIQSPTESNKPFPLSILSPTIDSGAIYAKTLKEKPYFGSGGIWPYFWCKEDRPLVFNNSYSLIGCPGDNGFATTEIKINQSGSKYLYYTNVYQGSFSSDDHYLALRNALAQKDGSYKEQVRIVDIATKKSEALPLEDCTTNIRGWDQGKLITVSDMQEDGFHATICYWNTDGTRYGRVLSYGMATSTTERPISKIGLLPSEANAAYIITGYDNAPNDRKCTVSAINLDDPNKHTQATFNPGVGHFYCVNFDGAKFLLDLSKFTTETPILNFKTEPQKDNGSLIISEMPSTKSSIIVISPNNKEIWKEGTSQTIQWTATGSDKDLPVDEIDLLRKTPTDNQFWNIGTIANNQPGTGNYTWKVSAKDTTGNILAGSQYKILIGRNVAKGTGPVAESEGYFTIIGK